MASDTSNTATRDSLDGAAKRAWNQAIGDFYHPPLPEPVIEHSPGSSSFFYINSHTWTVHLNTAGVPLYMNTSEAEPFLRSVCHHEIQHYLLCPYDGVTSGFMFSAARRHLNDDMAMFVVNLFADLVVETSLLLRFPRLTHQRIASSIHESTLRTSTHSDLWRIVAACYRTMWGFVLPPKIQLDNDIFELARKIAEIARKSMNIEARWPKACEKIAKLIAERIPEDENPFASGSGDCKVVTRGTQGESSDGSGATLPVDVDAVMGSPLENRNGDLAKKCSPGGPTRDIEDEMEKLAQDVNDRGGTIEDLEAVYILAGMGSPQATWIRFWYRAKARELVRFEITTPKTAGSVPLTPELWRLGDPIEDLDIVQSLQAFPVIVPNMSTRKWQHFYPEGAEREESLPDLLLVIDSSGSMTWAMGSKRVAGPYHTALVSAFAAMDFALRRGSRVAAINFSDGTRTCDWTSERGSVERILLAYQGGGTVAPVEKIREACEKAEKRVLALIITDAYVANWGKLVNVVSKLTQQEHRIVFFHIGAASGDRESKTHKDLRAAGAGVYGVKSVKDLPGLVVKEARDAYRGL